MDNQDSGQAFCIYRQSTRAGEPGVRIEGHMQGPRRGLGSIVRHVRLSSHYCFFSVRIPADLHRCLFAGCKHPNRTSLETQSIVEKLRDELRITGLKEGFR